MTEEGDSLGKGSPETVDYLRKWDLRVIQAEEGFRFAVDSLILAALADLPSRGRVMDLGSGNGVVSFIVARRRPQVEVVGLEIQPQMVERAKRGAVLNSLADRVSFVEGSYADVRRLFRPESFSYVISNPPYRERDAGRVPPNREEAIAKCEIEADLSHLVAAASYLLPTKGRFGVVFCAERVADLFWELKRASLEPKRAVFVHPRINEEAQFVFVEAVKNAKKGQLAVEAPLIIYDEHGRYTERMRELIGVR